MRRFIVVCWLVAGSVTALILFQIKQEVYTLEQEIADTQRDILRDQESVHVLQAEWSYLNDPARIAALAERHLKLAPIPPERIIAFDDLPMPGAPEDGTPGKQTPERHSPATLVTAPIATSGALRQ
jgi:cell division protein FtsL